MGIIHNFKKILFPRCTPGYASLVKEGIHYILNALPGSGNFTPVCLSSPRCINGYQRHTAMNKHLVQGGVAIFLGMLHAQETGISSGHLGPLAHVCLYLLFIKSSIKQ